MGILFSGAGVVSFMHFNVILYEEKVEMERGRESKSFGEFMVKKFPIFDKLLCSQKGFK